MAKLADHEIIPAVLAKIDHCDDYANCSHDRDSRDRFAKAADRLRDFATVELLCEGLGITREELDQRVTCLSCGNRYERGPLSCQQCHAPSNII